MTKMYLLEVYVIDHENMGLESIKDEIENGSKYINPNVMAAGEADIGEWEDDHILNKSATPVSVYRKYFEKN